MKLPIGWERARGCRDSDRLDFGCVSNKCCVNKMMEVLALIPARGGSRGLPRKNVVNFLGRPLIAWTIAAAAEAKVVTRIMVSTDDEEIASVARNEGAEVPFMRPRELARDDTLDWPVFVHALEWLSANQNYRPDLILHLRPTTPLRTSAMIDEGVALLAAAPGADSLRSVCTPYNNPFKMWLIEDGRLRPLIDTDIAEAYNQPRQNLPAAWWQTGTLDVTRPRTVIEKCSMTGDVIIPYVIDSRMACDIDDAFSLAVAEMGCRRLGLGPRQ